MLKKIKKFKISLRTSHLSKSLKKKINFQETNDSFDKILEQEIAQALPLILPSAIYNTFSKKDTPETLKQLWNQASNKAVSLSMAAVTISSSIEKNINQNSEFKSTVWNAIAWEGVDQSFRFVEKLIQDEAKLEGCECSPYYPIDSKHLADSLSLLESHKAEIQLHPENLLSPYYSRITFCFWTPARKR